MTQSIEQNSLPVLTRYMDSIGLPLDDRQREQFALYRTLLMQKNLHMNLTAIQDPHEVEIRHFLDSLCILPMLLEASGIDAKSFSCGSLIDVGTGAGFPGLPLKIILPDLKVTLLDSTAKRVLFLREVIDELGISGADAIHGRAEELAFSDEHRDRYTVSVARAVASLPTLCEYALPFVLPGHLFVAMKGKIDRDEISRSERAIRVLAGETAVIREYHLPGTDASRSLVMIRKTAKTPPHLPRKAGKPGKSPL